MGPLIILQVTAVFLIALAYVPGLPPYDAEFTAFRLTQSMPLKGALSMNSRLDNAEHLFEGAVKGAESFASFNGELYAGVVGGDIVKIVNDNTMVPVAKLGTSCGKNGVWEDEICGRPLGMRFDKKGVLYVADAYYGVFKVDVKTGAVTNLVPMTVAIEGKVPSIPNSLAIASDGCVYWSDSDLNFKLHDCLHCLLADGSGRLLRYDPATKTNTVLIDKLHFGNGVALAANEDFVLVSDLHKNRILRYYLKGPKKGTQDVFMDGLPGMPDNLASDGKGGFFVALTVVTGEDQPMLSQTLGPYPRVRKVLSRLLALIELPFVQIQTLMPNYYTTRIIHWLGNLEAVGFLVPKLGGFLNVDADGNVKESFFSVDGSLTAVSEVHEFGGAYYFGSFTNEYIGRVKKASLKQ